MTRRQRAAATFAGVRTVAAYELRVRHRARGWRALLALWFGLACAVTAVVGVLVTRTRDSDAPGRAGAPVFGYTVVVVLLLLLLVVPMLARPPDGRFAEGARTSPHLAGLEATEIALGELVAAWAVVGILVALALPALAAPMVLGDVSPVNVAAAAGVSAALLLCVAALAQWRVGWTYVLVLLLAFGTPFAYAGALKVTKYDDEVYDAAGRIVDTRVVSRPHKVWWVLAPNPFVVVGDAARPGLAPDASVADPLTDMSLAVRDARDFDRAVWPHGLIFFALAATAAGGVTATHLRSRQDHAVVR
jgi:ABC-2 type transport system permease protein